MEWPHLRLSVYAASLLRSHKKICHLDDGWCTFSLHRFPSKTEFFGGLALPFDPHRNLPDEYVACPTARSLTSSEIGGVPCARGRAILLPARARGLSVGEER